MDRIALEVRMDAIGQENKKTKYTTPRWVQAWFLGRSRDNWKRKYKECKAQTKRLKNQVNDVVRSRERWRSRAEELERENTALREQAALKKGGAGVGAPNR
jgi:hypothetical protein